MPVKRMRVFAGPNGSGKTTIFKGLLDSNKINLGVYINADGIEQTLFSSSVLFFDNYQLTVPDNDLREFIKASQFSPVKRNDEELWRKLRVENNVLTLETEVDSYLAADIAGFSRLRLLGYGISFTYETVMSHRNKIDFLKKAMQNEYKVYLYYIATEDPDINNNRVNVRVAQKGHPVAPEVIKNRYYRSLSNLKAAVKNTNRAFIFDNSGEQAKLIAEIKEGTEVLINEVVDIPNWVAEYLLEDNIF